MADIRDPEDEYDDEYKDFFDDDDDYFDDDMDECLACGNWYCRCCGCNCLFEEYYEDEEDD